MWDPASLEDHSSKEDDEKEAWLNILSHYFKMFGPFVSSKGALWIATAAAAAK